MDIDFSLVLVVLVAVSGLIWLLDALFLAPRRRQLAAARKQPDSVREPVLVEYSRSFFPVLLIVLVLRSFLVEPFQIPSGSMIPTLEVGDFILVNKYTYGLRLPVTGTKLLSVNEPERGEVIVFFPPHDHRYFIKRVVGMPGDTVVYENGELRINGETVDRASIGDVRIETAVGMMPGTRYTERLGDSEHQVQVVNGNRREGVRTQWVVPPGHYFMMGDNRDNSADSRVWGAVPEENIVGKAFAIWMHKEPGFNLPTFRRNSRIH